MARILIVEDNAEFRIMVANYIKRQHLPVEIFEAWTGEMAVAKAACIKPDIVIMDINLPNANGFKTTTVIREDCPDCDIIILTMFDVNAFKKMAKDIRVADFIAKTEVYDRLIPAIKKCLESRKTPAKP